MATATLIPSTYYVSSNVLSLTNEENMYTDISSTTYATLTNTESSTSYYYFYLRGFDFSSIPSNAEVSSFTIKIRGRASGAYNSAMYLAHGTTTISGATATQFPNSTTVTTRTFTIPSSLTWDTVSNYGSNFGIRVNCRRNSRRTQSYYYIYGAEIEVTYTVPIYHSITIQNSTSADVQASETNPLEGEDVIISTNILTGLTIKDNGVNVTSQFTPATGGTVSAVPGSEFTTGFSTSSANFYQDSSTTSTSWLEYAIGHSAESPYSTSNTNNTYVKPESATGWINYEFDFSEIPASATINSMSVKVYGAREDSTIDSTHVARFQCYSGNTAKGSIQNFTSTSNSSVTITDPGSWTASELHDAQLRFEIGYYGGRMLGITWTVTYTVSGYIYTITSIATDHTIVVTSSGVIDIIYYKNNNSWIAATAVYKKINGSWVQQTDLTSVFDANTNYVKGG